jgi:hypothetical protein
MVNEAVFGLRRPDAMIIEFLEVIYRFELGRFVGFVVATVEETFPIFRPGRAGELYLFEVVAPILAGLHIPHLPFLPVGA